MDSITSKNGNKINGNGSLEILYSRKIRTTYAIVVMILPIPYKRNPTIPSLKIFLSPRRLIVVPVTNKIFQN
jgi:hypothetical protein